MKTCAGEQTAKESAAVFPLPPISDSSCCRQASNSDHFRENRGVLIQRFELLVGVQTQSLFIA
jgi:hypothetical protein